MLLLVDIPDEKKGKEWLEKNESNPFMHLKMLDSKFWNVFEELTVIMTAKENAELVKSGKMPTRPARDLLNDL